MPGPSRASSQADRPPGAGGAGQGQSFGIDGISRGATAVVVGVKMAAGIVAVRAPANGGRGSDDQAVHRLYRVAVREDAASQDTALKTEMFPEHTLQHGAKVGSRLQVAVGIERALAKAWPIGNDPSALDGAADEDGHSRGAVIRAAGSGSV